MSLPEISAAPWDLAAGNRWTLMQDGYTDHGNESIIAKDGQIVAFVAGGMESGNGALLAAAPALRNALFGMVKRHERYDGCAGCLDCGEARTALKQAGAL